MIYDTHARTNAPIRFLTCACSHNNVDLHTSRDAPTSRHNCVSSLDSASVCVCVCMEAFVSIQLFPVSNRMRSVEMSRVVSDGVVTAVWLCEVISRTLQLPLAKCSIFACAVVVFGKIEMVDFLNFKSVRLQILVVWLNSDEIVCIFSKINLCESLLSRWCVKG